MVQRRWAWLAGIVLMFGFASCGAEPLPGEDAAVGRIVCPFDVPARGPASHVTCYRVAAPERHADPGGPAIELAVAVFQAKRLFPSPGPLVMAEGGPGGSGLAGLAAAFATPEAAFLYRTRDLVVIEQRGTFYSLPSLDCPGAPPPGVAAAGGDDRPLAEVHAACRDRLIAEGVDLAAYNSIENAADVPWVVRALGYDEYNFMGLSYGTMLGQHLMRDYPAGLRSVVLDSVAPLDASFLPALAESGTRAFDALFAACAADPYCAETAPNLDEAFASAVARYDADPAPATVSAPEGAESFDVTVDGEFLNRYLFESLYDAELIPTLPAYITAAAAGDLTWVEQHGYALLIEDTFSEGMFYTVLCAEDRGFEPSPGPDPYPPLGAVAAEEWAEFEALCEVWDVPPLGERANQPVESSIPTLLLAGEFDPITPPAFAERVAAGLPNSAVVTLPGASHGVIGAGSCPFEVLLAFLDDPAAPVDAACAGDMAVRFDRPLESYTLAPTETMGVRVLIPDGWVEHESGVFRPVLAPDGRTLRVLRLPDANATRAGREYVLAQNPESWQKLGVEAEGPFRWHIFLMQTGADLTIVCAAAHGDVIYALAFTAPEAVVGNLADAVYFPAVRAFEVVGE